MENIDLTCDHQQKYQLEIHQRAASDRATAHASWELIEGMYLTGDMARS